MNFRFYRDFFTSFTICSENIVRLYASLSDLMIKILYNNIQMDTDDISIISFYVSVQLVCYAVFCILLQRMNCLSLAWIFNFKSIQFL